MCEKLPPCTQVGASGDASSYCGAGAAPSASVCIPEPEHCEPASAVHCDPPTAVASFLSKLHYDLNLPATTCSIIADGMHEIIENISAGTTDGSVIQERCRQTSKACRKYRSAYKTARFTEKHFGTIRPKTFILSGPHEKKRSFQYVSVKQQLRRLLLLGLLTGMLCPSTTGPRPEMTLRDIWDGSSHPISGGTKILSLILYYDDFTVSNPLGTHAKRGKVGAIYFTVGNFSKESRSKIRNIYIALLFRSSHIKKYGWAKILKPFLEEMKEMERDGLGQDFSVRIECVIADNLAAHGIAGLSENFSTSVCRFCLMPRAEMKSCTRSSLTSDIRETFAQERQKLDRGERSIFKRTPPLIELCTYRITDCHPPDLGHDLFEGVCPLLLSHVLTSICVDKKAVQVSVINSIIRNFEYTGIDKENQPRTLIVKRGQVTIRQSMSECLALTRLLPFMIGHLIPCCDEWHLYISFVRIVEALLAPSITQTELMSLETSIRQFLVDFIAIYGPVMTPKMHFMLHYPEEIRKHGPLRNLWTLRFEQKNQSLKRLLEQNRCRKNVCLSMAVKHQHAMARWLTMPDYLREGKECVVLSRSSGAIRRVRIASQVYTIGDVLFVKNGGNVQAAVVVGFEMSYIIRVEMCDTVEYDVMRNVYKVKRTGVTKSISSDSLAVYHPTTAYGPYIVLPHAVSGFGSLG